MHGLRSTVKETELVDQVRFIMARILEEERNNSDTFWLYNDLGVVLDEYSRLRMASKEYAGILYR